MTATLETDFLQDDDQEIAAHLEEEQELDEEAKKALRYMETVGFTKINRDAFLRGLKVEDPYAEVATHELVLRQEGDPREVIDPSKSRLCLSPSSNSLGLIKERIVNLSEEVDAILSEGYEARLAEVLKRDRWTLEMLERAFDVIPRSRECLKVISLNRGRLNPYVFAEAKGLWYVRGGRVYRGDEAAVLTREWNQKERERLRVMDLFTDVNLKGVEGIFYVLKERYAVYV